jgi:small-conductance mechanosensitive channel
MWRRHLAVWATHPLAHGWHHTIADLCRWPYLVAAGLVTYTATVAGYALELSTTSRGVVWAWGADAVVATWAVGTVVLFAFGQLVVVPRVTGHAARAHRPSLSPVFRHRTDGDMAHLGNFRTWAQAAEAVTDDRDLAAEVC